MKTMKLLRRLWFPVYRHIRVVLVDIRIIPLSIPEARIKLYPLAIRGEVIPAKAPQQIATGNSLKISDLRLINGRKELISPVIPAASTAPIPVSKFNPQVTTAPIAVKRTIRRSIFLNTEVLNFKFLKQKKVRNNETVRSMSTRSGYERFSKIAAIKKV